MIELIGLFVTVVAVTGVVLNNARRRTCFLFWIVSNAMSAVVHLSATPALHTMAARDAIFLVLAVAGWKKWGRRTDEHPTANKEYPISK